MRAQPDIDRIAEERILRERANRLAAVPAEESQAGEQLEVVRFQLGTRQYAIDAAYVFATRWLRELAPVPEAPRAIVGITPQQGGVLAVVALDLLFGNTPTGLRDTHRIVVVGRERPELALAAGKDIEMAWVEADALLPAPATRERASRALIAGTTEAGMALLDGDALLRDERLFSRSARSPGPTRTTPGGAEGRL